MGVICWLQVCPKRLALRGGVKPSGGGLVPYPPRLSPPQHLSDMRAIESGFQRTMDGGVGCFTEGVNDDDP